MLREDSNYLSWDFIWLTMVFSCYLYPSFGHLFIHYLLQLMGFGLEKVSIPHRMVCGFPAPGFTQAFPVTYDVNLSWTWDLFPFISYLFCINLWTPSPFHPHINPRFPDFFVTFRILSPGRQDLTHGSKNPKLCNETLPFLQCGTRKQEM